MTIQAIDEKLSVLREAWLDACVEKKSVWMEKINAALDERLVLMREKQ